MLSSQIIPLLFAAVLPACLLWAAFSDALTMTIPNRLNLILAGSLIPFGLLLGLSPAEWGLHLGVGALALIVGMALFAVRALGGGDAKLLAASLLWLANGAILPYILFTAVAGGALSLIIILARKYLGLYSGHAPSWLRRHLEPKGDIPYGIALCIGGLMAIPYSSLKPVFTGLGL